MGLQEKGYSVYILECGDGTLYTGIAKDVADRIRKHSLGKGAKYTRNRLPLRLVFMVSEFSRSDALKVEVQIKKLSRVEKRMLISLHGLV